MATTRHHAICVTGNDEDALHRARSKAQYFGLHITPLFNTKMNDCSSFFVVPDGSNEGHSTSREGDRGRDAYTTWLRAGLPPGASAPAPDRLSPVLKQCCCAGQYGY